MEHLFTLSSLGFFGIAIFGMAMHAVKKWVSGEIDGNLFDWYLVNPRYTVGVLMAVLGATASAIAAGAYVSLQDSGMVTTCFLAAYAIDGLNKQ